MKRIVLLSLFLLVMTLSLPCLNAFAATEGSCGENLYWHFDESSGIMTISGYGEMKTIEHPPWLSNYRLKITQVIIEDGCKSIASGAFSGCNNLRSVTLPKSVTRIGNSAFRGCWSLEDPVLDYVTEIEDMAFEECTSLTVLNIPAGVTIINSNSFGKCHNIKEIIFHDKLTVIDNDAFRGCVGLTSIVIPDSVTYIGSYAFASCSRLITADTGNGVTEMGNGVFSQCTRLESVRLSDKLVKLNNYMFHDCTALKQLYLGTNLQEVNAYAFQKCTSLKAFTLSGKNQNFFLDKGVLYRANPMELIAMPPGFSSTYTVLEGTTKIGPNACHGAGLTGLTVPGTVTDIDRNAFEECTNLKTIQLSEGLKIINSNAFSRTAIESLTIPASVTEIKPMVFFWCTSLKEIVFKGAPPEIDSNALSDVDIVAYFPGHIAEWAGARDLYGGSPTWVPDCTLGHTPVEVAKSYPTCTNPGKTAGSYCRFCGSTVVEQEVIPAVGHRFTEWVVTQAPTENQEGKAKRLCRTCETIEEKTLEKQSIETEPPVTEPPVTEPPVTEPPVTEPPVTEPPVTQPPVTQPPVTQPPVTEPPVTQPEPDKTESQPTTTPPSEQSTQGDSPWKSIVIIAAILLAGAGISIPLLKKKFRL